MNTEMEISVGRNIARLRNQRGMTQAELSEKMDLTPSYISCVENGKRGLTIKHVICLSKILGVSCDDILRGESQDVQVDTLYRLLQSCPKQYLPSVIEANRSLIEGFLKVTEGND